MRNADKAAKKAAKATQAANDIATELEMIAIQYRTGDRTIQFNVDVTADTVWATQQQMADLFEVSLGTVSRHIANIYEDGELDEASTLAKNARVQTEGARDVSREISVYNLDMILSVGYRVSSAKATAFRRWATKVLREYIIRGAALNERRLVNDPTALQDLAERVRALRNSEAASYAQVRQAFAMAASDYDANSDVARSFFATVQDKLHFAVSERTAAELVLQRADHRDPQMGMQAYRGEQPTVADAKIGKNYLDEDELYGLNGLSEMLLIFIEMEARAKRQLTMAQLRSKLDAFLAVAEKPLFKGYAGHASRKAADKHAMAQYAMFSMRRPRPPRRTP